MVGDESSRGKLSACLGAEGFENKMWESYAATKMYAKSSLNEAAMALQVGEKLVRGVAVPRIIGAAAGKCLSASCRHNGSTSDDGGRIKRDWSELFKIHELNA